MSATSARRVGVVTGGSGTIGSEIARGLAASGVSVVVAYHNSDEAAMSVVQEIREDGGSAAALPLDVTDRSSVTNFVERCVADFGRLDILVNNAGLMRRQPFLTASEDDWDVTMAVNVKGCFLCSQAAGRVMARQRAGVIVNITSTNDTIATPQTAAYAASKGAVRMLTKQLALELAPYGIRTNAVAPGMVESDFNRKELSARDFRADAISRIPVRRFATAKDVARAVCFLASDDASFITGATLRVDGGRIIA